MGAGAAERPQYMWQARSGAVEQHWCNFRYQLFDTKQYFYNRI